MDSGHFAALTIKPGRYVRSIMTQEKDKLAAKQKVHKLLNSLTDLERQSIEERFGIIDENFDFDSIEHDLKRTRLKIRKIEAKALRKLKKLRDMPPDDIA